MVSFRGHDLQQKLCCLSQTICSLKHVSNAFAQAHRVWLCCGRRDLSGSYHFSKLRLLKQRHALYAREFYKPRQSRASHFDPGASRARSRDLLHAGGLNITWSGKLLILDANMLIYRVWCLIFIITVWLSYSQSLMKHRLNTFYLRRDT